MPLFVGMCVCWLSAVSSGVRWYDLLCHGLCMYVVSQGYGGLGDGRDGGGGWYAFQRMPRS